MNVKEIEEKLKSGEIVSKLTGELRERTKREYFCSGVSSRVSERKHVLFMDLDGKNLDQTMKITVKLMHKYELSECYIIQSSYGNYHMICLDKFDFGKVCKIMKPYAHGEWVRYRSKSEDFVLRLSIKGMKPQPRLMCILRSPYNIRTKSNAHRILMNKQYDTRIRRDNTFDDSTKLKIHIYRTRLVKK